MPIPQNSNAKAMTTQPQATEMSETLFLYSRISCSLEILLDLMKASTPTEEQAQCEHQHKTSRLRGGGAGKVCSLAYLPRGLRASVCNHLPCRTASLPCSGASFASVRLSLPYGLHSSLTYSFSECCEVCY